MRGISCISPRQLESIVVEAPHLMPGHSIIKIKQIGICGTDLHAFDGSQPYFTYPRILGHELSGIIEETTDTEGLQVGDKVSVIPYIHCGVCGACKNGKTNCCTHMKVLGVHMDGGMVEYLSVPNHLLVTGNDMSFEALTLIEPLAIGAHGVRRAGIGEKDIVLVIGAGPIGLGTMELARLTGAYVIALDTNMSRLTYCKNHFDIQHTLQASDQHLNEKLKEITHGDMPSVVIDATGNLQAINNAFQYIAHGGTYILIGLQKGDIHFSHPEFHKRESTLMSSRNATRSDFEHVKKCLSDYKIKPQNYITHKTSFENVLFEFPSWLDPKSQVIKAIAEIA